MCFLALSSIKADNGWALATEITPVIAKLIFCIRSVFLFCVHIDQENTGTLRDRYQAVTNFIQLVSPQPVDQFSLTKLRWKAPNESYPQICRMYKSDNKRLRYHDISSCKSFVC